jgi:HSP20 family molecular chaperone IbpA
MVSATLEQYPAARFATLGGIGLDRAFGDSLPQQPGNCALPTDVVETGEELRFAMEVPGIRPQDIEVSVEDGVLTVVAEKGADPTAARCRLAERRTAGSRDVSACRVPWIRHGCRRPVPTGC